MATTTQSIWTADPQSPWQLLLPIPPFLLDSLDKLVLQYILDDQIFRPSLTIIGDPETKAQFEQRLPLFRLTFKHRPHQFRQLDLSHISLLHHLQPTTNLSLQDYISRFTQDTSFSLLKTDIFTLDSSVANN